MNRILVFALAILILCGCTAGGIDIEQEDATGLAGELLDGHSFGQTFTLEYNGLYRIDLYTATYARKNTHPVIFRITASAPIEQKQGEGPDHVRMEIPADQISNSGPTVITFPSLDQTAGQTLYFYVESPGSVPGDAISVYRNEKDVYPNGQMVVDGQPTDGDLAFIVYTRETFTAGEIWDNFYSRASQDKPFFIFYCSLIAMLFLAFLITLLWSSHKVKTRNGRERADKHTAASGPKSESDE